MLKAIKKVARTKQNCPRSLELHIFIQAVSLCKMILTQFKTKILQRKQIVKYNRTKKSNQYYMGHCY